MLAWLRDLNAKERRTMVACFAGWTLDGFDGQLYSYVVPTVIALWGLSAGATGTIGTVTLLTSSLGGWLAGTLADRFGRVRVLQLAVLWYSVATFLCAFAQNFEQLFVLRDSATTAVGRSAHSSRPWWDSRRRSCRWGPRSRCSAASPPF